MGRSRLWRTCWGRKKIFEGTGFPGRLLVDPLDVKPSGQSERRSGENRPYQWKGSLDLPEGGSEAGRRQPRRSRTRFLIILTAIKILGAIFFWRGWLDNRNGQTRLDPARIMAPCRSPGSWRRGQPGFIGGRREGGEETAGAYANSMLTQR